MRRRRRRCFHTVDAPGGSVGPPTVGPPGGSASASEGPSSDFARRWDRHARTRAQALASHPAEGENTRNFSHLYIHLPTAPGPSRRLASQLLNINVPRHFA